MNGTSLPNAHYFQSKAPVPHEVLIDLTRAARAPGLSWAQIAAECGVTEYHDMAGVASGPGGRIPVTAAGSLFAATQYAIEKLTGGRRYPPPVWPCSECGQQVTDRAAVGRPIHIQHGHGTGCPRLTRDQAADTAERRDRIPQMVEQSEPPAGQLQQHRLREAIIDDCPRCGWSGYFHEHLATIDGDWSSAVCDNCYADLHPDITVSVAYFSARPADRPEPYAVIRQRTRSDHRYPDLGEQMVWRLCWEHTTLLIDEQRGSVTGEIRPVSRGEAEQIMAHLADRYWPPDAARLPWVKSAYSQAPLRSNGLKGGRP